MPPGFQEIGHAGGFSFSFGRVGLNLAAKKMGFFVAPRHLNPVSVCHGGAISTFADMQILAITGDADLLTRHTPTISLSVDYLAPAALGSWVEAQVTLLKSTRHMIFTQALIFADAQLVARSQAIYRNVRQ
ncbi:uncharacterized domain 1-containing protein [Solimonas aquatica]|uniref:Uncharacterized domain 1-containing protein n=1 Tax=Solimonas aquatica TaxID=489703 RepID=A0A1H9BEG6_9GAMM|nr:PaaI family thioesterase [Solimonas aquatica]SEP87259.1 uncharacterized domain 1-containing protein [Solimonas aquatica]